MGAQIMAKHAKIIGMWGFGGIYYHCNIFHCTFIRFNFNNGCILKWARKFPENSILSSCEPGCIQSDTPRCKSVAPGEMQPELMHQPRLLPTRVQSGPLGHPDLSLPKSILAFMLSHRSLSLFSIFQKICKYNSVYGRILLENSMPMMDWR